MARPHIEPFCDRDTSFKSMVLPGFSRGMSYKMLSLDVDTGGGADQTRGVQTTMLLPPSKILVQDP